jgi:hypothetical protein
MTSVVDPRDEEWVANMQDKSEEDKAALALFGLKPEVKLLPRLISPWRSSMPRQGRFGQHRSVVRWYGVAAGRLRLVIASSSLQQWPPRAEFHCWPLARCPPQS